MSETVIQVKGLSKAYQLGAIGTGSLSEDLGQLWNGVFSKRESKNKPATLNDRTKSAAKGEMVWALKGLNFDINRGDVVGIIGRNGAGKSTLLKLLSQITSPTEGEIRIKGRLAALLEVGTGFHPELSGKENIYLNGAILGMSKAEINANLNDIVEFAGVRKYLDTPVKRYSSGMLVRLGFAVAAHLEPEILIVDEVLAVGDFEFQEKCIGKMKEVSSSGRTILFVSHNMASVKSLCTRGILLSKGQLEFEGSISSTIEKYLEGASKAGLDGEIPQDASTISKGILRFDRIQIKDEKKNEISNLLYSQPINLEVNYHALQAVKNGFFDVRISTIDGIEVLHSSHIYEDKFFHLSMGENQFKVKIRNDLQPGKYTITLGFHELSGNTLEYVEHIREFSVMAIGHNESPGYAFSYPMGIIKAESKWEI